MLDWSPFVEFVGRHQRFLLTTHIRPDGDGLGSVQALADVLERRGKTVQRVIASVMPPRYDFLDPEHRIERYQEPGDAYRGCDALIVLDTGTWGQLGDLAPFIRQLPVEKVVIDHHVTQDDLGATRFVDVTAEAVGRLTYEAIQALGGPLPPSAANSLFTALAMDTGWFRHSNTSAATMALAGELIRAGARPNVLNELLFDRNTLPRMKLTGLVLERLSLEHSGGIGWSEIRRVDYSATGAVPQDTEDLVNYTLGVAGVKVGLLFMEQPRGGVKVSFRSRCHVDVARLAERYGGGGHCAAAGAIVDQPLETVRATVLKAVAAALDTPP
jgi:phosphoesterase RecJ-like protein